MVSFCISIVCLVLGYVFYGRFVERVFGPDDRPTPATMRNDKVDFVVLPSWKIFMIQFLNIAGTGPIFGALMGAKFGPSCYLWIVFGCIFGGAMHDYLAGMLSLRYDGISLPEIIGKYLGNVTKHVMLLVTSVLLLLVVAIFVYSPAVILAGVFGHIGWWIVVIFAYYFIATMLPVSQVIARIYPLFAAALIVMSVLVLGCIFIHVDGMPEVWDGLGSRLPDPQTGSIFPYLFITVACGAISGFHATQSPMMARCMRSEWQGRPIFYGTMITEGLISLIWAAVGSYLFYGTPAPGYTLIASIAESGLNTSAPAAVNAVCVHWLGMFGGVLALLGVVAAPITTGDTALRSSRLILADFLNISQRSIRNRLLITAPLMIICILLLWWQIADVEGFAIVWVYFGWLNQLLSIFTLWALTVYLASKGKSFVITLLPAIFMTAVCVTFPLVSRESLGMDMSHVPFIAIMVSLVSFGAFVLWYKRQAVRRGSASIKRYFFKLH